MLSRALPKASDLATQFAKIDFFTPQSGAAQQQTVVIGGESFVDPEVLAKYFSVPVALGPDGRADPLYQPGMEILMTGEPEKLSIGGVIGSVKVATATQ